MVAQAADDRLEQAGTKARFTPREAEILLLLSQGLADKQIASILSISLSTLRTHIHRLFTKTGCFSRAGLVAAWLAVQPKRF
ncbi:LuxR family transcriptional regulator [bacterium]|nr:MAG: LuxR family transcriptional regulator [bacterium]